MCTPTSEALSLSDVLTEGDYGYYIEGVYHVCRYGPASELSYNSTSNFNQVNLPVL